MASGLESIGVVSRRWVWLEFIGVSSGCSIAHLPSFCCTTTSMHICTRNSFGQFSIRMCSHRCPIGVRAMTNVRAGKTKAQVGSRIKKI